MSKKRPRESASGSPLPSAPSSPIGKDTSAPTHDHATRKRKKLDTSDSSLQPTLTTGTDSIATGTSHVLNFTKAQISGSVTDVQHQQNKENDTEQQEHKDQVLLYLSLGNRPDTSFPIRLFMRIHESNAVAMFEAFVDPKKHECLLISKQTGLQFNVGSNDVKAYILYNQNPTDYMTFWDIITTVFRETVIDDGSELSVNLRF